MASELETFLARAEQSQRCVPGFVEHELRAFLRCGILKHGFVRVRCPACRVDAAVGFSCKGRGMCPSCAGRRMCETAADLVDRVLPFARTRQWVLSLPWGLRWKLAFDPKTTTAVLGVWTRALAGWVRRRVRAVLEQERAAVQSGAVTMIQRFGSALNLNVHFHTLMPDVGWVEGSEDSTLRRVDLPPPTDAEVRELLVTVVRRIERCLKRRGVLDVDGTLMPSESNEAPSLLDVASGASVAGRIGTGERAGQRVEQAGAEAVAPRSPRGEGPQRRGRRCWEYAGFSIHADVAIRADDRERLEKLCRYTLRGPVANERLRELGDGRYAYVFKRPWRDGTTAVVFTAHELLEKLSVLIPRPGTHLTRYHGVFAPNAKLRPEVIKEAVDRAATKLVKAAAYEQRSEAAKWVMERRRLEWADLMKRAWLTDVLVCDRCGGPRVVIATIHDQELADEMLDAMKIEQEVPEVSRARPPPELGEWDGQLQLDVDDVA